LSISQDQTEDRQQKDFFETEFFHPQFYYSSQENSIWREKKINLFVTRKCIQRLL
jgi:hypothetical protein